MYCELDIDMTTAISLCLLIDSDHAIKISSSTYFL